MIEENRAKVMIETLCKSFRALNAPNPQFEFILKHGRAFNHAMSDEELGTPNECYRNATREVTMGNRTDCFYAEGYHASPDFALPLLHGWIVDPRGVVIETTLDRDVSATHYFGIVYRTDFVRKQMCEHGCWGILGGEYQQAGDLIFNTPTTEWRQ